MFTWGNGSFVVSSFIYVPSLNPKLFQLENLKKPVSVFVLTRRGTSLTGYLEVF